MTIKSKIKGLLAGTLCSLLVSIGSVQANDLVVPNDSLTPTELASSSEFIEGDRELIEYLRGVCKDGKEHMAIWRHDKGCIEDTTITSGVYEVKGDANLTTDMMGITSMITYGHCHNLFAQNIVFENLDEHPLMDLQTRYDRRYFSRIPSPIDIDIETGEIGGDIPTMISNTGTMKAVNSYGAVRNLLVLFEEDGVLEEPRTRVFVFGTKNGVENELVYRIVERMKAAQDFNNAFSSNLSKRKHKSLARKLAEADTEQNWALTDLSNKYSTIFNDFYTSHCAFMAGYDCAEPTLEGFIEKVNESEQFYIHELKE